MNTEVQLNIEEVIGAIVAPPETYLAQARTRLDSLTKPLGSLGRVAPVDLLLQHYAVHAGLEQREDEAALALQLTQAVQDLCRRSRRRI